MNNCIERKDLAEIAIKRVLAGKHSNPIIYLGDQKTGKTENLQRVRKIAKENNVHVVDIIALSDYTFNYQLAAGFSDITNYTYKRSNDLYDLIERTGEYLRERGKAVALFIDEIHLMTDAQLLELLIGLQYISREQFPIIAFGASDFTFKGRVGNLYGDSEMMFEYVRLYKKW